MTASSDAEYGVHSPFLLQCLSFLAEEGAGGTGFHPLDSGMREHVTLFYGPSLPHGIPSFNFQRNEWDFFGESQDPANLRLEVSGDGHFLVGEGDDDGVFIDLRLEAPEEIGEVLALVRSLTESNVTDAERRSVALADIVSSIGIAVPQKERHEWNSIQPADIARVRPDAARILDAFFHQGDINWDYIVEIGFQGWVAWSREARESSHAVASRAIPSGALIISKRLDLCSYRRWLALGELFKDDEPALVIELNRSLCSLMYFTDFVTAAAEAKGLIEGLLHNWREPWSFLRTQRIDLPVSVVTQLRASVELRSAKWQYKQRFDALLREREPMAQIVKLYQRRIRDIALVHSEYLEEIQIVKAAAPIPD